MLINKIHNLTYRSDQVSSEPSIPDPWQTPISAPKVKTTAETCPEAWHLPRETNPLISPAGNPNALKLTSHQSTSEEILLGDELKLKTTVGRRIKQQLEQALALLYWLKTVDRVVLSE